MVEYRHRGNLPAWHPIRCIGRLPLITCGVSGQSNHMHSIKTPQPYAETPHCTKDSTPELHDATTQKSLIIALIRSPQTLILRNNCRHSGPCHRELGSEDRRCRCAIPILNSQSQTLQRVDMQMKPHLLGLSRCGLNGRGERERGALRCTKRACEGSICGACMFGQARDIIVCLGSADVESDRALLRRMMWELWRARIMWYHCSCLAPTSPGNSTSYI